MPARVCCELLFSGLIKCPLKNIFFLESSLDSPDNDSEEDYTNLKEDILPLNQKLQKINNNLIKQRTDKNGEEVIALPKNILIEKEDILPKYTHLMAFRPDYTIR